MVLIFLKSQRMVKKYQSLLSGVYSFTIIGVHRRVDKVCMGMIGLVVVGDDTSNKDKIAKARFKALGKSKKKLKKLLSEL